MNPIGQSYVESSLNEKLIAGVDEVGRGSLFGPVVAAAIIIKSSSLVHLQSIGVKDSKKISANKRIKLAAQIKELVLDWKVSQISASVIDEINILQASLLAMKEAVDQLTPQPEISLIDGRFSLPNLSSPQIPIVKGDQKSLVIGAASIIAKVWRDELIINLANQYPQYDLLANKGYGTQKHLAALRKYGYSDLHRKSFKIHKSV